MMAMGRLRWRGSSAQRERCLQAAQLMEGKHPAELTELLRGAEPPPKHMGRNTPRLRRSPSTMPTMTRWQLDLPMARVGHGWRWGTLDERYGDPAANGGEG
jgi:hypothetical protein